MSNFSGPSSYDGTSRFPKEYQEILNRQPSTSDAASTLSEKASSVVEENSNNKTEEEKSQEDVAAEEMPKEAEEEKEKGAKEERDTDNVDEQDEVKEPEMEVTKDDKVIEETGHENCEDREDEKGDDEEGYIGKDKDDVLASPSREKRQLDNDEAAKDGEKSVDEENNSECGSEDTEGPEEGFEEDQSGAKVWRRSFVGSNWQRFCISAGQVRERGRGH